MWSQSGVSLYKHSYVRNDILKIHVRSKLFIVFNWKISLVIRVSAYKKFNLM